MVLAGIALQSVAGAIAIGVGMFALGGASVVRGLRARRQATTPEGRRERAEHAYRTTRWSLWLLAASLPFVVAVFLAYAGLTLTTALVLGGLALTAITGIASQVRLLAHFREQARSAESPLRRDS